MAGAPPGPPELLVVDRLAGSPLPAVAAAARAALAYAAEANDRPARLTIVTETDRLENALQRTLAPVCNGVLRPDLVLRVVSMDDLADARPPHDPVVLWLVDDGVYEDGHWAPLPELLAARDAFMRDHGAWAPRVLFATRRADDARTDAAAHVARFYNVRHPEAVDDRAVCAALGLSMAELFALRGADDRPRALEALGVMIALRV